VRRRTSRISAPATIDGADYSNVAVDPVNDIDLWTIQEYAGTGNTWGTWWGTIALSEPGRYADRHGYPDANSDANANSHAEAEAHHRSRSGLRTEANPTATPTFFLERRIAPVQANFAEGPGQEEVHLCYRRLAEMLQIDELSEHKDIDNLSHNCILIRST